MKAQEILQGPYNLFIICITCVQETSFTYSTVMSQLYKITQYLPSTRVFDMYFTNFYFICVHFYNIEVELMQTIRKTVFFELLCLYTHKHVLTQFFPCYLFFIYCRT